MEKIAAVVVTYNRKMLLSHCIEKIQAQTVKTDIIVVDNASTDDTSSLFEKKEKNIRYFNTGKNLGGAGGFYYGIKKAVELGYDDLWILDDDTMPTETALEVFINTDKMMDGKYGFLSSKVLWKDNSICAMNIQKKTKWRRIKNFSKIQSVQYASFVSLFIKSKIVKELGLPYKEFFIWADDWEYTRRISKRHKSFFVPESIVNHWSNTNVGANIITTETDRMDRFKYMYRNDVVLYRQDRIDGNFYLFVRNLLHKFRIIKANNNVSEKLRLIKNATKEGKSFYPVIEFPKED